jgi:hypothetical protein
MPKMPETRYVTLDDLLISNFADSFARHYSYECKATTQERPYTARPSRTQQLLNPRLVPKLSEDVPTDVQTYVSNESLINFLLVPLDEF